MQLNELPLAKTEAENSLALANDLPALNDWYSKNLGSKGWIEAAVKDIRVQPSDQRGLYGKSVNDVKTFLNEIYKVKKEAIEVSASRVKDFQDFTLPGDRIHVGSLHPISQVIQRMVEIFTGMGFIAVDGPEIDSEEYNFTYLNMDENHPARDDVDTFYILDDLILRSHTTTVQVRTLLEKKNDEPLLVRICSPGRVFRRDKPDRTHFAMFHQVEGLIVGEGINLSHLYGTLLSFSKQLLGPDTKVRLRPDHFPYVEPGAEVAISCPFCKGVGCKVCKFSGWIETGGSGMVHPEVMERIGLDSKRYSGLAFGIGAERYAQLLYNVEDGRWFYEGNLQFLNQFI